MAFVITLNSENRLVFEKYNGEQITMQDPITQENKHNIMNQFSEYMSTDTLMRVLEVGNCQVLAEWRINMINRTVSALTAELPSHRLTMSSTAMSASG
eukprot:1691429-Heterocapsa_arctica.AAC.1